MIKVTAIADNQNLDALFKLFDNYTTEVLDLAQETFEDLRPAHLEEFQKQPRVRRWPQDYPNGELPFDTDKQRRWYWANIGKPYSRTGQMAKGLRQDINRDANSIQVVAVYPDKSTKFVLGNILGEKVERFQQRFHKVTGWEEAAPKLERHAQAYVDAFARRYEAFIAFYQG